MSRNTTQLLLTKGDNNVADDFQLYRGIEYLEREHIIGKVRGYVSSILTGLRLMTRFLPYVGYVTIAMVSFYPLLISRLAS
jgi:signal peptidase